MVLMAQRATKYNMPSISAPVSKLRLPGQLKGSRCQRPFLKRAIVAQALKQTGSDSPREQGWFLESSRSAQALAASCAAALASALVAASPAVASLGPADVQQLQDTVNEVWGSADSRFVDPIDRPAWSMALQVASEQVQHAETKEDGYSAIQAMLATLGDPFTRILAPNQSQVFQADTTGQLVHIGMQAQRADTEAGPFVRELKVSHCAGSPAHKAGVHVGDIVTAINGRPAASIAPKELSGLLRHDVQLLVRQNRPKVPLTTRNLYLQARPVEVYPVIYSLLPGERPDAPVGYVAIQSFGTNTGHDAAAALHSLHAQGASSYVIDLRGNSGGLVSAGLDVSGLLLHKDDVFVHVSHRDGYEGPMTVEEEGFLAGSPMALLVNSGTASTTEMLAASLHDNAHAQLIGEHSYGKGRTQRILNMKDGSTLLVSTSLVTTPTFHRIDKVGLQPDLFCKSGADLPDALKSEPLEDEKLSQDLQADPCVRMAMHTLRDAPALSGHL